MSPIYAYARVSSIDQDLSLQRAALKAAGATIIRAEKAPGTSRTAAASLRRFFSSCGPAPR